MARALHDKLRVERYIPSDARTVLDVGCADGALTMAMAALRPHTAFLGVDLNESFITQAGAHVRALGLPPARLRFEAVYLRDLLSREMRFDAVIFASVLHEFYSYGEGISSVIKALADAHELLRPGGVIVIRDMVLGHYATAATLRCPEIRAAIARSAHAATLEAFEAYWGRAATQHALTHFLLKYRWTENWQRELPETYLGVSVEQYDQMFALLGMTMQTQETYLLDYWRECWRGDFALTDDDLAVLRSTTMLVAQRASDP
jgi:2-polyprenyl-3-methyl-5-hydroxy-6-metoxy-1,4-benzoquinol methylase